jgi:hypothetical protein
MVRSIAVLKYTSATQEKPNQGFNSPLPNFLFYQAKFLSLIPYLCRPFTKITGVVPVVS